MKEYATNIAKPKLCQFGEGCNHPAVGLIANDYAETPICRLHSNHFKLWGEVFSGVSVLSISKKEYAAYELLGSEEREAYTQAKSKRCEVPQHLEYDYKKALFTFV